MSIVTRLEVPITFVGNPLGLIVTYPHGGSVYAYRPSVDTFAHKQALLEDITTWLSDNSIPLTIAENYATRAVTIATTALNFSLDFGDTSNFGEATLADYLGFAATYSNKSTVTGRACESTCYLDAPPEADGFAISLNRSANFSDSGRVAGVLLNRYVQYACTLNIANDEHEDFRAFWAWAAQCHKLTMWRRFNTAWTPAQAYVSTPLLGDNFKLLSLTDGTNDDLDVPRDAPDVTGHTHDIEGWVYGV